MRAKHAGCAQSAFAVCVLLLLAFSAMITFHRANAAAVAGIAPGVALALTLDDQALSANPAMMLLGRDRSQLSAMATHMMREPRPTTSPAALLEPLTAGQAVRLAMVAPPLAEVKPLAALTVSASRSRSLAFGRSPSRGFSGLSGSSAVLKAPMRTFEISSRYGWRGRRFHNGIDLTAPIGTPIVAAEAGLVVKATREPQYGNIVEIQHGNGLKTRYAHMNALAVRSGQRVRVGQRLGGVGITGNATGPHLHFEVLSADVSHNPERFLWR